MRLLALLVLIGCASTATTSRSDAIKIATETATATGVKVADYDLANVTDDADSWHVLFALKPPGRPGGHFMVVVAKADGAARFVPGR